MNILGLDEDGGNDSGMRKVFNGVSLLLKNLKWFSKRKMPCGWIYMELFPY